jgi:hypothetical protein
MAQTGQVQVCTRAARRCRFVSSGTFIHASILVQGRAPLRIHPSSCERKTRGDGTKVLGALCSVIHLGDMTPGHHFGEELLAGKEPVHQEMQGALQPVQETLLNLAVMRVHLHELADDGVVLLFYVSIVIPVIGTGSNSTPCLTLKGSGVSLMSRVSQRRRRWQG